MDLLDFHTRRKRMARGALITTTTARDRSAASLEKSTPAAWNQALTHTHPRKNIACMNQNA
jgi:hypothetical protein